MMGVQTINEIAGLYQISKGVSKSDLEKIQLNPNTRSIQLVSPLADKEVELLEEVVFSKRKDILLRIYGHYNDSCNLTFIKQIPSLRKVSADCLMEAKGVEVVSELQNLEMLGIGIFNLDNFDFLDKINSNLKQLYLHQTRSKKPKIESIKRFGQLEFLYLEGQQKGIEAISNLKALQKIVLRSISTNNIDYLKGLENLWSVDVKLGGIKDFTALTTLPTIKYLELWQVRGLADLSFISGLPTLQNLFIQSLKQVVKLPDFSRCKSLRRIYLENLKSLIDLSSLKNAPNLKEFIYILAENHEPESILPALENVSLYSVGCGFGNQRRNNRFAELAKQHGKKQFEYSEFKYL